MPETFELLREAIPSRLEKRRIAATLRYNDESTIYKWCEDPDGSGKANPLDRLEAVLDHALIHHPDAALAMLQWLNAKADGVLIARGESVRILDLVAALQPQTAKETGEARDAMATALRQGLLGGRCDGPQLLREMEEGERALKSAIVQLRAAVAADEQKAGGDDA